MIIRNIGSRIIHIEGQLLLPENSITVPENVGELNSVKTLEAMNFIVLIPEKVEAPATVVEEGDSAKTTNKRSARKGGTVAGE